MLGLIACWPALLAQNPAATIQAGDERHHRLGSSHPIPIAHGGLPLRCRSQRYRSVLPLSPSPMANSWPALRLSLGGPGDGLASLCRWPKSSQMGSRLPIYHPAPRCLRCWLLVMPTMPRCSRPLMPWPGWRSQWIRRRAPPRSIRPKKDLAGPGLDRFSPAGQTLGAIRCQHCAGPGWRTC